MTHRIITAFSGLLLGFLYCQSSLLAAETENCVDSSLALVNGKIHTMDERDSVVSSVLIRGGRFVAMDPDDKVFDDCTEIVDLEQRTVIPGLIDNHVHYIRIANRPGYDHRDLEVTFTLADALSSIQQKT